MTQATRSIVGLFGKLPSYGDFLTRDLPNQFVEVWDAWLQGYVRGGQEQLGDHWLDVYLTSPIWRFTLSRGVVDENIWLGITLPSVDRVGRYFPFSIACSVETSLPVTVISAQAEQWFEQVEAIVLGALEQHTQIDPLLEQLNALPLVINTGYEGLPFEASAQGIVTPSATPNFDNQDLYPYLLDSALQQLHTSYSLWQTNGSQYVAPCVMAAKALPPISGIAAMLDGDWTQSHWAMPFYCRAVQPEQVAAPHEDVPLTVEATEPEPAVYIPDNFMDDDDWPTAPPVAQAQFNQKEEDTHRLPEADDSAYFNESASGLESHQADSQATSASAALTAISDFSEVDEAPQTVAEEPAPPIFSSSATDPFAAGSDEPSWQPAALAGAEEAESLPDAHSGDQAEPTAPEGFIISGVDASQIEIADDDPFGLETLDSEVEQHKRDQTES